MFCFQVVRALFPIGLLLCAVFGYAGMTNGQEDNARQQVVEAAAKLDALVESLKPFMVQGTQNRPDNRYEVGFIWAVNDDDFEIYASATNVAAQPSGKVSGLFKYERILTNPLTNQHWYLNAKLRDGKLLPDSMHKKRLAPITFGQLGPISTLFKVACGDRFFTLSELVDYCETVSNGGLQELSGGDAHDSESVQFFDMFPPKVLGKPEKIRVGIGSKSGLMRRLEVSTRYKEQDTNPFVSIYEVTKIVPYQDRLVPSETSCLSVTAEQETPKLLSTLTFSFTEDFQFDPTWIDQFFPENSVVQIIDTPVQLGNTQKEVPVEIVGPNGIVVETLEPVGDDEAKRNKHFERMKGLSRPLLNVDYVQPIPLLDQISNAASGTRNSGASSNRPYAAILSLVLVLCGLIVFFRWRSRK